MNRVVNTNKEVRFTVTIAWNSRGFMGMCQKVFSLDHLCDHNLKLEVKNTSKKKSLKKLVA